MGKIYRELRKNHEWIFTQLAKPRDNGFPVRVQRLEPADFHRLNAVVGWLGLNCPADARAELAALAPSLAGHPAVLEAHWLLAAHERNWSEALNIARQQLIATPEDCSGWLHQAYALRRVADGGLPQAKAALLPAAEKFPAEAVVPYNLACYTCQLQELAEAREWLKRAMKAGGKENIQKMALADDDLKPLWLEIEKY